MLAPVGLSVVVAVAVGCSGSAQENAAITTAYVLLPEFSEVPEAVAAVRGVVEYREGADRYPEYAKVIRCSLRKGSIVGQLQYSADPPGSIALTLSFFDRSNRRTFTGPSRVLRPVATSADARSGRTTFQVEVVAPGFTPDSGSEYRYGDCRARIDQRP